MHILDQDLDALLDSFELSPNSYEIRSAITECKDWLDLPRIKLFYQQLIWLEHDTYRDSVNS